MVHIAQPMQVWTLHAVCLCLSLHISGCSLCAPVCLCLYVCLHLSTQRMCICVHLHLHTVHVHVCLCLHMFAVSGHRAKASAHVL